MKPQYAIIILQCVGTLRLNVGAFNVKNSKFFPYPSQNSLWKDISVNGHST